MEIYESAEKEQASAILTGQARLPGNVIQQHRGPNGKTLSYVSHVYANEVLRRAFGPYWESHVLPGTLEVHPDGTATCLLTLRVGFYDPKKDDRVWQSCTVVAPFGAINNDKMPYAYKLAAAESRGLPRAMFRLFLFAKELYSKDEAEDLSPIEAYNILVRRVTKAKLDKSVLDDFLRQHNTKIEHLSDPTIYEQIYLAVGELIERKTGRMVDLPKFLGGDQDDEPEEAPQENDAAPFDTEPKPEPKPEPEPELAAPASEQAEDEPEELDDVVDESEIVPTSRSELRNMLEAQGYDLSECLARIKQEWGEKFQQEHVADYWRFITVDAPIEWKPTTWEQIEQGIAAIGRNPDRVTKLLAEAFPTYDEKDIPKYWEFIRNKFA